MANSLGLGHEKPGKMAAEYKGQNEMSEITIAWESARHLKHIGSKILGVCKFKATVLKCIHVVEYVSRNCDVPCRIPEILIHLNRW